MVRRGRYNRRSLTGPAVRQTEHIACFEIQLAPARGQVCLNQIPDQLSVKVDSDRRIEVQVPRLGPPRLGQNDMQTPFPQCPVGAE